MMKGVNFQFTATNKAAPAMQSFQSGLRAVQKQTEQTRAGNASWMKSMDANRRTVQQFGMQISDFAIQIGGGQGAMLAFVQQAPQMLQFFGAGGAAAAAFVAIFGTMALVMMKSGVAMSQVTPILGILEEKFKTIAAVVVWFGNVMIDAVNILVNNLDTVLIAAGMLAGYFAGPWLVSLIAGSAAMTALRGVMMATVLSFQLAGAGAAAMTLATSVLTGAMNVLRVALMRLGIPALIIAAAWLIERLMTLREKTGSWAEVLKLLGDVAKGVWTGITESAKAIVPALSGVWNSIVASFYLMVADMVSAWATMLYSLGTSVQTSMPGIAQKMFDSMDSAVTAADSLLNASWDRSDAAAQQFAEAGKTVTDAWAPAAAALQKIKDILGTDTQIDVRDWFGGDAGGDGAGGNLEKLAKSLEDVKKLYGQTIMQFEALGPLGAPGIAQLHQMWAKFVQDMKTTSNPAGVIEQFKNALGEAGKQAQQLYDAVRSPLEDMFMSMVDGTKSVKDAFKSMAVSVIKELFRIMVVQKLVNSILGAFNISNPTAAAPPVAVTSYAGGGYTGYGARSGGVDGKGGFPALLHPNETVVDHTMGQGSGGVVVNQTISFGSGVTRAEVQSMIPKIVDATKAAVLDARKRGGSYGSAFA